VSCTAVGCTQKVYARGLCERHDKQRQRHGAVQPDRLPADCAVEACGRGAVTRGWCHGHYLRWSRTDDVRSEVPLDRPQPDVCQVEDCVRGVHSLGLCRTHVGRVRATGDPLADLPIQTATGRGSISHGYRKVVVPLDLLHLTGGERNVLEHRLVMAQALGRALHPGEVVHHVNGDRLDNRAANLELWSVAQPSGQRVADKLEFAYEILRRYDPDAARVLGLGTTGPEALGLESQRPGD